jgi:hypothetical protein
MARSATVYPTRKVAAAGLAGAVSTVFVWGLHQFFYVDIPQEVAAACITILAFFAGYITPPANGEVIEDARYETKVSRST